MISPTRRRGFSDAYGSWKIICSSRRYGLSSRCESVVMSSPPKRSVPLVGSSSLTRSRPSVDLPQPDSPTIPSVSPRRTSSETPSTAWTTSDEPRFNARAFTGKCLTRSTASSRTAVRAHAVFLAKRAARRRIEMAGVAAAGLHALERAPASSSRARSGTGSEARSGSRAAARAATAARPGSPSSRLHARPAEPRDRVEQPPGVRVLRVAEHGRLRPLLDDAARVHDDDPLGELRDDAHVVRDQHDRRVVLALSRFISARICAWIVTSSAVVGSSAISSDGLHESAIAIITRCRMPPEN